MASTVHYKFKSQKDYDSIEFDGMFISVGDLKRQIVDKRGLGRDQAMELQLTNAQTNEDYEDDAVLVWKNTSVIAKRVPRDQLAAVGSEVGSTTVKKTVYVPPPQIPAGTEFRKPPPRRNMTYIAPGAAGADGAPADTSADPSIAALVSGAASAWETEKAAASAMGRGAGRGGGRGAPAAGGAWEAADAAWTPADRPRPVTSASGAPYPATGSTSARRTAIRTWTSCA